VGESLKLLVILGIFAFIVLLIYLRLRPFIRMARQMFTVAGEVRRVVRQQPVSNQTAGAGDKLVRCENCETWIPAARAVKLRSSNASYCSHACLERAATGSKRQATG
jgi:hypothetical protein